MPRDPQVPPPPASEPRTGEHAAAPAHAATPAHTTSARTAPEPALPEKSFEDTDAAWGDYREPDDSERLNRDRPPHWDDF
jgi:hypothetical protein